MTKYYFAKSHEGLDRRSIMVFLLRKSVVRYVLLNEGCCSEIPPFLGLRTEVAPTIRVKMFITLENIYEASKVNVRMFIKLEIPFEAGEGNGVLIKCNTIAEAIPRVLSPMGIPPKPPDVVIDLITTIHNIHF